MTLVSGFQAHSHCPRPFANAGMPAVTSRRAILAGQLQRADAGLSRDIAHADLAWMATGERAVKKAIDSKVKEFARTMIDDRTQTLGDGTPLAPAEDVELPTEQSQMHVGHGSTAESRLHRISDSALFMLSLQSMQRQN